MKKVFLVFTYFVLAFLLGQQAFAASRAPSPVEPMIHLPVDFSRIFEQDDSDGIGQRKLAELKTVILRNLPRDGSNFSRISLIAFHRDQLSEILTHMNALMERSEGEGGLSDDLKRKFGAVVDLVISNHDFRWTGAYGYKSPEIVQVKLPQFIMGMRSLRNLDCQNVAVSVGDLSKMIETHPKMAIAVDLEKPKVSALLALSSKCASKGVACLYDGERLDCPVVPASYPRRLASLMNGIVGVIELSHHSYASRLHSYPGRLVGYADTAVRVDQPTSGKTVVYASYPGRDRQSLIFDGGALDEAGLEALVDRQARIDKGTQSFAIRSGEVIAAARQAKLAAKASYSRRLTKEEGDDL
ncbi:MAG: hypothetical protein WCG05_03540 [Alphaproteobacteria bacterium]